MAILTEEGIRKRYKAVAAMSDEKILSMDLANKRACVTEDERKAIEGSYIPNIVTVIVKRKIGCAIVGLFFLAVSFSSVFLMIILSIVGITIYEYVAWIISIPIVTILMVTGIRKLEALAKEAHKKEIENKYNEFFFKLREAARQNPNLYKKNPQSEITFNEDSDFFKPRAAFDENTNTKKEKRLSTNAKVLICVVALLVLGCVALVLPTVL